MRFQKWPNIIWDPGDRRICLTRIYWTRGTVGDGKGYSAKLSISLCLVWQDQWVGRFVKSRPAGWRNGWVNYICLLPCLPIRLSLVRSYGGVHG